MPFINDRIVDQQAMVIQQRHEDMPVRQSRFRFQPDVVSRHLREHIVGQDDVLSAIDDMLHVVKADIRHQQRPLSVMLFLGPTGVGKTETARLVAEAIHGSSDALCRIDMNTLSQAHYAAALTGAPPGYVGSKEGHSLFDKDKIKGSFSMPGVVLFDELEKASAEVTRSLLNVLDSGQLTLSSGQQSLDFRNSLIFMSSNVGAREAEAMANRPRRYFFGGSQERQIVERSLRNTFDPEFLNRIDVIIQFRPLQREQLDGVLDIELEKLQGRLAKREVELELDSACRSYLLSKCEQRYGARDVARRLRRELEPTIARAMLATPNCRQFLALVQNERLAVEPIQVGE